MRAVGLIGAGKLGRVHARNIVERVEDLRLAAVADVFADAARSLADELGVEATAGVDELLARNDVNAVVIASPPDSHSELIVAAAEAGKHVFCEKPLALDVESGTRAVEAAERAGVVLQIGYNRRFDSNFRAVREAVRGGKVGTPWLLRISSRDPEPPPAAYLPHSGGVFLDTTSHDFDLARFVLGAEITELAARGAPLVDPNAAALGDVDTLAVSLAFSNGTIGAIDNCRRSAYGYDQRLEVHGSGGLASAGNEMSSTMTFADETGLHAAGLPHFYLDRYADAFVRELEAFAAALEGGDLEVSGRDGLQAVVAAVAARRSLDDHRVVRLDELR
jgi:myo-inositol 2-dehydrogenase / D-chiro-inositol 1-dehydrogenase